MPPSPSSVEISGSSRRPEGGQWQWKERESEDAFMNRLQDTDGSLPEPLTDCTLASRVPLPLSCLSFLQETGLPHRFASLSLSSHRTSHALPCSALTTLPATARVGGGGAGLPLLSSASVCPSDVAAARQLSLKRPLCVARYASLQQRPQSAPTRESD